MSMSRYRTEYPGAYYHVIQRGNNREHIFNGDGDKGVFLGKAGALKAAYDFKLLGYVLMDNHYHFLVQTGEKPLSEIMHRLNSFYSHNFNRRYSRSGHVFEGRYKAGLIQDEDYLFAVLRYIHWNPVRAGLCQSAAEYYWSSDMYYRRNLGGLVDIDDILDNFATNNREEAVKEYIRMVQKDDPENYDEKSVIGDKSFKKSMKPRKKVEQKKDLDCILLGTGVSTADFELIKEGSRKRNLTPYKIAYAKKAMEYHYTYREIGQNIRLSDVAVYKLIYK